MNEGQQSIAEKLRYYRESCALSQKQVADALNVERSTYTKYETGDSTPGLETVVKIARIFNVSPLKLLPEIDIDDENRLVDSVRADSPIFQLNKDERRLIALYRVLSKEDRRTAQELVANLSKKES